MVELFTLRSAVTLYTSIFETVLTESVPEDFAKTSAFGSIPKLNATFDETPVG
jgi:hypothetical protein